MFILPYVYHHRKLPHLSLYEVSVLTIGGTNLWVEDESLCVKNDILEPNGLSVLSQHTHKDVVICHVDKSQLDMTEYFHWNKETSKPDTDLFCWRTFYLIASLQVPTDTYTELWLPFPTTERLGPYACQDLFSTILPVLTP